MKVETIGFRPFTTPSRYVTERDVWTATRRDLGQLTSVIRVLHILRTVFRVTNQQDLGLITEGLSWT
jgi:hypothetical protein